MSSYFRYDYRTVSFTIPADAAGIVNAQLQTTGVEPLIVEIDGGDVEVSYQSSMANPILLQDGMYLTYEVAHPFGNQIYMRTAATASEATVTFQIAGGVQNGSRV